MTEVNRDDLLIYLLVCLCITCAGVGEDRPEVLKNERFTKFRKFYYNRVQRDEKDEYGMIRRQRESLVAEKALRYWDLGTLLSSAGDKSLPGGPLQPQLR